MFVRAKIQLSESVTDLDLWAVDIIEGSTLSEILENGWWWCTWPNHIVELFFDISSDIGNKDKYLSEVKKIIGKGTNIVSETVSLKKDATNDT